MALPLVGLGGRPVSHHQKNIRLWNNRLNNGGHKSFAWNFFPFLCLDLESKDIWQGRGGQMMSALLLHGSSMVKVRANIKPHTSYRCEKVCPKWRMLGGCSGEELHNPFRERSCILWSRVRIWGPISRTNPGSATYRLGDLDKLLNLSVSQFLHL